MGLNESFSAGQLAEAVRDARERTFELVADLSDEQLMGPRLPILNPLRWEIGHVAWFQEKWVLRAGGQLPSFRADADALYDSMAVPHDTRWDLPLPSREEMLAYCREVRDGILRRIEAGCAVEYLEGGAVPLSTFLTTPVNLRPLVVGPPETLQRIRTVLYERPSGIDTLGE